MVDIRDAFFDEFYEVGARDKNVVFLTDDMDAFSLRKFKQDFPSQFINIGVAEQNIVNLAAGLAMCGKKVFVYGICSFITMRCFEQIKVNLCSMRLPVTIIGAGAGFSFGFDGPTHHGTQDIAIMRSLPEISIYNLSDSSLASASVHLAYSSREPVYIRLDKGEFPELGSTEDDFSDGFRVLKPLQPVNIVSTGFMTLQALSVAEELGKRSIDVGVVDLYRLKPVGGTFIQKVLKCSQEIVTIEENSMIGGIGSIVAEMVADEQVNVNIRRLAVQDKQFIGYGSREWFHDRNHLDVNSLAERLAS